LNPKGCLIVNGDDAPLVSLVSRYSGQIIKFGLKTTGNDLFATDIECDHKGVHFNLNGNPRRRLFVPLLGRHSACNALAAIAVGRKMNIPKTRSSTAWPTRRRSICGCSFRRLTASRC
jgi:UDP-N-acetylmuramyl pentapeptide synthase